jgi:hypothetical protein
LTPGPAAGGGVFVSVYFFSAASIACAIAACPCRRAMSAGLSPILGDAIREFRIRSTSSTPWTSRIAFDVRDVARSSRESLHDDDILGRREFQRNVDVDATGIMAEEQHARPRRNADRVIGAITAPLIFSSRSHRARSDSAAARPVRASGPLSIAKGREGASRAA